MKKLLPFFSQNSLNRLDHTRRDPKSIQNLLGAQNTRFLLFFEGKLLVQDLEYLFSQQILATCRYKREKAILLGEFENICYFCIALEEKPQELIQTDLRAFAIQSQISQTKLGILAQAASVLHWHESHRFCGYCGNATEVSNAGWRRVCLTCKKQHFPRIDPVVIMLVTHGEFCLLGKGKRFKENRYSCLAGFMENGESIEDAARRELFEEAGVIGEEVNYLASQPWPFPNNLMIGVHVKAKETKLTIDPFEIVDAQWFHKDEVKDLLEGRSNFDFEIPGRVAIARNLLEWWVSD